MPDRRLKLEERKLESTRDQQRKVSVLVAENAEEFFSSEVHYLKPVLFTKKAETPSLWLRLSEAFGECCKFGEIRHTETALMERFAVSPDALPKIIAVTHDGDGGERVIPYEGPSDFDRISEFLVETGGGRSPALELKRELEMQKREMKSLRQELEREKEALQVARTEIARSKLGQVGQVEAVKKSLEAELAEAKEREKSLRAQVESESRVFSAEIIKLKEEKQLLSDKLMALEAAQGERVVMLNSRNADAFLASTIRPLKAVLFTTKTDVPPLWQQLAEAQSMTTAFGVVRHVEEDVLESFELTAADLPHICIFRGRGRENPVVYDGEVKLEALSSFLRDAVEGGETVIAMRQQMHSAMRQVEHLTEQLEERSRKSKEAEAEAEAEAEEMKRRHEEEMARVVREHQEAIRDVQEQMAKLQQESKKRIRMAEEEVEHMKTEMEAERSAVSKDLQEHLKMMEEEVCAAIDLAPLLTRWKFSAERSRWNMLRELVAQLDSEILLVDRLSRSCEKAVLRASSAVHVTLVRRARETERMQASLREFIDDVAPSQVISAINYGDNQLRAKSLLTSDGESLIESLTTQYKSLKSRINDLDFLGDKRALDLERPSSSSKFVGGKKPERRPEDGESRSVSQRGGSEGISDTLSDTASVRSGSKSSETLSGHKDEEGKSWGEASQRKGGVEDGKMDAAKLQRAKKKQANELVNIAGLDEEISIGRLTREVEKTETKNVFSWRDKRLIDDETGSLVYAYPRWLEEVK
ncbi:hypothetical protein GUITHDRAFT_116649 [Guillardia theta CCMP2712]|uniref:Thioredoxin domain-containing protein n=1 Tax=Guillardia theta (strain CCMP2712) TaxID=905079 RepID=L1IN59_GUITC|nr:hypothetical protein GUITHDRAFT_116649 [Guillardia theta CCMP2712]EKX37235.1 hypothetical protein GUITHDRAFT_116649 [Guillardia theta CCMP2712]|eukprot:XP_005824215.1 hypothetical protein GUITHDRAFT_116649 [Guillardia theta CCMP2712]